MSDKTFNFDLGNRHLTANETKAVEIANGKIRESLERHGQLKTTFGMAIVKATSQTGGPANQKPRGTDVIFGNPNRVPRGTDVLRDNASPRPEGAPGASKAPSGWATNKAAPRNRKY